MTVRVIRLPWTTPPLSLNSREHWARTARTTAEVRRIVGWLAQRHRIPYRDRIAVTLVYVPADARRRDADNLVPVLKAACDGLVDAGIVDDDTPRYMVKAMPVIAAPDHHGPRMELRIDLDPEPSPDGGSSETRCPASPNGQKVTDRVTEETP